MFVKLKDYIINTDYIIRICESYGGHDKYQYDTSDGKTWGIDKEDFTKLVNKLGI